MKILKKSKKEISNETPKDVEVFLDQATKDLCYKDRLGQLISIKSGNKVFQTLRDQAIIEWDYSKGYNAQVTLEGNRTLAIPTNVDPGDSGTLRIVQDTTGTRTLSLPSNFRTVNGGGGAISLSTTPGSTDILTWVYDGTYFYATEEMSFSAWNDYSVTFDGATGTYIDLTNNAALQPAGAFTVSGWLYIDNIGLNHTVLANNTAVGAKGYVFWVTVATKNIALTVNDGAVWTSCQGTTTFAAGQWYHVAASYAGTSSEIKVYVNGQLETTVLSTATPITYTGAGGYIGKYNISRSSGKIDEVALFSSVLTGAQINSIYNGGSPADLTSLTPVAWYRMGDGDTSPVIINHGSAGAPINGTLTTLPLGTDGFIVNTP